MSIVHKSPHLSPILTLSWKTLLDIQSRVTVGVGARHHVVDTLKQLGVGKRVLLLHQPGFGDEFVNTIMHELNAQNFEVEKRAVPDGEDGKDLSQLTQIWQWLNEGSFDRKDTILALGGGALSDVAGFAASTYKRGVNLVLVPTTLLAQVDAAIGGKTAINLSHAKNLAGTFFFPRAVIVDSELLRTLSLRQFASGLAEIIKYALIEETICSHSEYQIGHMRLLDLLEESLSSTFAYDDPMLSGIITTCIKMKLCVVGKDPQESGLRRCLNLGHTLGHALEKESNYSLSHGEAIAIGMACVLKLSNRKKRIDESSLSRAIDLLLRAGLPVEIPQGVNKQGIIEAMMHDKKREGDTIMLVLPAGHLGLVDFEFKVPVSELENLL